MIKAAIHVVHNNKTKDALVASDTKYGVANAVYEVEDMVFAADESIIGADVTTTFTLLKDDAPILKSYKYEEFLSQYENKEADYSDCGV